MPQTTTSPSIEGSLLHAAPHTQRCATPQKLSSSALMLLRCRHCPIRPPCPRPMVFVSLMSTLTSELDPAHHMQSAAQATINPYSGSCDTIDVAGQKLGVSKGTLAAAIIGAVFGVLILCALIGAIVWCCCCQLRR